MLVERGGEMYAEAGLLYPYFQCFSQELQQLEEFCFSQKTNASMVTISLFCVCIFWIGLKQCGS